MENIKFMVKYLLTLFIFLLLLGSCRTNNEPPERGFYFWKTNFSLSTTEAIRLHNLKISKIYIRLFDVDWDRGLDSEIPEGEIRFNERPDSLFAIVPVVFITNKTLLNIKVDNCSKLAEKIFVQICYIMESNRSPFGKFNWTAIGPKVLEINISR